MLRIALISLLAALAISCNQPKIEVTPTQQTITKGDSVLFTIQAKRYTRIDVSVNDQYLFAITPETYDPPYYIIFPNAGEYTVLFWAENISGSRLKAANQYSYITVTN